MSEGRKNSKGPLMPCFYERVPLRAAGGKEPKATPEPKSMPEAEPKPASEVPTEEHYRLNNADLAALGGGNVQIGHEILGGLFPYMLQEPGVVPSWAVTVLGHGDAETGKKIL